MATDQTDTAQKVTSQTKAIRGAMGAACLSIVKFTAGKYITAGFAAMIGFGIGSLCYIIVGAVVAEHFAEDYADNGKTKRSAFIAGIVAPGLVVALFANPQLARESSIPDIPTLSTNISMIPFPVPFISDSFAESPTDDQGALLNANGKPFVLGRDYAAPGIADGFKAALGIASEQPTFYVVGKSNDQQTASKTADFLNKSFGSTVLGGNNAMVVRPYNGHTFYVTVGSALTSSAAVERQRQIKAWATEKLTDGASTDDKTAAAILLKGQTVPSDSLFTPR
ncbi:hypothetical protein [Paraburkholderia sp.]|uniref:hypothetical protein n=1 Tax=Paraburkholderia sp. TaxID=1926495 RepID=UPI003D6FA10B